MNAAEHARGKFLLQFSHAPPQQVGFRTHMQTHVIIGRFNPVNLGNLYEQNSSDTLDHDALRYGRRLSSVHDLLFRALEGALEAGVVEGFQKIIERSRLERAQRILVIGSYE